MAVILFPFFKSLFLLLFLNPLKICSEILNNVVFEISTWHCERCNLDRISKVLIFLFQIFKFLVEIFSLQSGYLLLEFPHYLNSRLIILCLCLSYLSLSFFFNKSLCLSLAYACEFQLTNLFLGIKIDFLNLSLKTLVHCLNFHSGYLHFLLLNGLTNSL